VRQRAYQVFLGFRETYDAKSLAPYLASENPLVQSGVLQMLIQVGSAELAPQVLPLLRSATPWVRNAAVSALSNWDVREARDEIRKLADDSDPHVRRTVFIALSDEKPRVLAAIRDPQLRDLALGIAGRAKMEEAIPDLRKLMEEGDPDLLPHVLGALVDLGARDLIPRLTKMLDEPETRYTAVNLLGRLGARETLPTLVRMCDPERHDGTLLEALGALKVTVVDLEPHLRSDHPVDRRRGILVLQRIRPPGAAERIAPLAADPDPGVRTQVLSALGEFDDPSLLGPAAERLIADPDPNLRSYSTYFLMRSRGDAAFPALRRLLEDPVPSVRREAIRRLLATFTKDDVPRLTGFLRDEVTACAAAEALGGIGVREAIPDVLSHLKAHKCGEAAEALGRLDARETVPVLEKLLAEGDEIEGLPAALCRLGSAAGASHLVGGGRGFPFPLNALRTPTVWEKLRAIRLTAPLKGGNREVLEKIGQAAGLPVEVPADDTREWKVEIAAGISLLAAIEESGWDHVVLEADRLRVLDVDAERRFWRAWWRERQKR
jgi:HEAT repeat protein